MPDLFVVNQGIVQKTAVPGPGPLVFRTPRLNPNGEGFNHQPLYPAQAAGVEDAYYTYANQGTRDTGVALGATAGATYSATNDMLIIANINPAGGPDVILDYVRIKADTIAGGTPTFWQIYHQMDTGNRYSSGTGLIQGFNAAGNDAPGVKLYSGTLVAAAATVAGMAHDIGHNILNNGASVAQAQWLIKFGGEELPPGTYTTPTTAVAQTVVNGPVVVIHPGWCYLMNEYWTGRTTTALIGEMFVGLTVR